MEQSFAVLGVGMEQQTFSNIYTKTEISHLLLPRPSSEVPLAQTEPREQTCERTWRTRDEFVSISSRWLLKSTQTETESISILGLRNDWVFVVSDQFLKEKKK